MCAQLCTPESACAGQPDQIVTRWRCRILAAGRGKAASMGARSILQASSLHSAVVAACDACSNAAAQIHHRATTRRHQTEAARCRRSQCRRASAHAGPKQTELRHGAVPMCTRFGCSTPGWALLGSHGRTSAIRGLPESSCQRHRPKTSASIPKSLAH